MPDPENENQQNIPEESPDSPLETDSDQSAADSLAKREQSKEWTEERIKGITKAALQEALSEATQGNPPPQAPNMPGSGPPSPPYQPQDDRAIVQNMDDRQLRQTHRQLLRGDLDVENPDAALDLIESEMEGRRLNAIRNEMKSESRRTQSQAVVTQVYPMDDQKFFSEYQAQLQAINGDPNYRNVPEKEMIAANYAGARLGILPKHVQSNAQNLSRQPEPDAGLEGGHWPQRPTSAQPKERPITEAERRLASKMTGFTGEQLEKHLKRVREIEKDLPDYHAMVGIAGAVKK